MLNQNICIYSSLAKCSRTDLPMNDPTDTAMNICVMPTLHSVLNCVDSHSSFVRKVFFLSPLQWKKLRKLHNQFNVTQCLQCIFQKQSLIWRCCVRGLLRKWSQGRSEIMQRKQDRDRRSLARVRSQAESQRGGVSPDSYTYSSHSSGATWGYKLPKVWISLVWAVKQA